MSIKGSAVRFSRSTLGGAATAIATLVLTAGVISTSLQYGGNLRTPIAGARGAPATGSPTRSNALLTTPSLTYPALPLKPSVPPAPTLWASPSSVSYVLPGSVSFPTAAIGWVLGEGCDAHGACEMVMARTTDGGADWTLVSPPVEGQQTAWSLRVLAASARDAWVWGYQGQGSGPALFVATHDGGATWQAIDTGSMVVASLALGGNTVWAVTGCPSSVPACSVHLLSSSTTGGAWTDLGPVPAATTVEPQSNVFLHGPELVRAGGCAWVLVTTGGFGTGGGFVRSSDGGAAWLHLRIPCEGSMSPIGLAASSADEIMLVCGAGGAWPAPQEVWASADGGSTWHLRSRSFAMSMASPLPAIGHLDSQGLPAGISMLDAQTAWIWGDREQDMVSDDGGVTWTAHSDLPYGNWGGAEGLTFSDPLHGWTFGSDGLWSTVDGGRRWRREPVIGLVPGFPDSG